MSEPKRNFIQDQVMTTNRTDPIYSTVLYDVVSNISTEAVLRTQCELGTYATPTDNYESRYDTINDFGRTYSLYLDALISTSATPGTLTIAVKAISSGGIYTLQTVTFTPDASLVNAPLQISGLAVSEFFMPQSVNGYIGFSGAGWYAGSAGYSKPFSLIDAGTAQANWAILVSPSNTSNIKLRASVTWQTASTSNIFQCRELAWLER